jgi:hypothetical protein
MSLETSWPLEMSPEASPGSERGVSGGQAALVHPVLHWTPRPGLFAYTGPVHAKEAQPAKWWGGRGSAGRAMDTPESSRTRGRQQGLFTSQGSSPQCPSQGRSLEARTPLGRRGNPVNPRRGSLCLARIVTWQQRHLLATPAVRAGGLKISPKGKLMPRRAATDVHR